MAKSYMSDEQLASLLKNLKSWLASSDEKAAKDIAMKRGGRLKKKRRRYAGGGAPAGPVAPAAPAATGVAPQQPRALTAAQASPYGQSAAVTAATNQFNQPPSNFQSMVQNRAIPEPWQQRFSSLPQGIQNWFTNYLQNAGGGQRGQNGFLSKMGNAMSGEMARPTGGVPMGAMQQFYGGGDPNWGFHRADGGRTNAADNAIRIARGVR